MPLWRRGPVLRDEGTDITRRPYINFIGSSVTVTDDAANSESEVTISGGGGGLTLTTVEVSLGSAPAAARSGHFIITTTGLTSGKPVAIMQANGPYTGKGTRVDEAEMDKVIVSGKTISTTQIECFWKSQHRVRGNFKFDYAVSS